MEVISWEERACGEIALAHDPLEGATGLNVVFPTSATWSPLALGLALGLFAVAFHLESCFPKRESKCDIRCVAHRAEADA